MIAEIIQSLYEMLGQPEIFFGNKVIRSIKDMRHLQSDGLYQTFRMLRQFLILRRRHPILWFECQNFLYPLQSIYTSEGVAAEDTGNSNGDTIGTRRIIRERVSVTIALLSSW
jgi:hypothetical protein